jgi:hypothetical protein
MASSQSRCMAVSEWSNAMRSRGGGRPKGVRNRLAVQVFEDILQHWNEPVEPGSDRRKGPAALEVCFKEARGDQFVARKRGPPITLAARDKYDLALFVGEPIVRLA